MLVRVRCLGTEEGAGAGTGTVVGTEEGTAGGYGYGGWVRKKVRLVGTVSNHRIISYHVIYLMCKDTSNHAAKLLEDLWV